MGLVGGWKKFNRMSVSANDPLRRKIVRVVPKSVGSGTVRGGQHWLSESTICKLHCKDFSGTRKKMRQEIHEKVTMGSRATLAWTRLMAFGADSVTAIIPSEFLYKCNQPFHNRFVPNRLNISVALGCPLTSQDFLKCKARRFLLHLAPVIAGSSHPRLRL
jgi:hypothetical protein